MSRRRRRAGCPLQGGRCATAGRVIHREIDHDHAIGLVRGPLCGPCNTANPTPPAASHHGRTPRPARHSPPTGRAHRLRRTARRPTDKRLSSQPLMAPC
ncbi:endonuclease domain-containing protein [Nonomuraea sp. NBC_00507]|uniref:endonuclease domain-containing protein n=1 Tax=Nonomuraea sp. NBC_00507 TaxID=2976002 RepID=UPI003FA55983